MQNLYKIFKLSQHIQKILNCSIIENEKDYRSKKDLMQTKRLGELTPLVASISKPLIITALLLSLAKTALLITLNSQLTKPASPESTAKKGN
ncbi:hypothetical protein CGSMWGv1400E_05392 [Gardnerella vaginalis 1400E]|uniref:Uncharacterized protein n=1 Tax=Gardnerella vaginalis 1400E TaxID=698956 RepID=I4LTZ9_GARVA|nr:hypothetical protein CGSMWGv1400E_05392 [Gardnerella vaginalis 1400E]